MFIKHPPVLVQHQFSCNLTNLSRICNLVFSCESSVFYNEISYFSAATEWQHWSRLNLNLVESRLSHRLELLFNLCGNKVKTV